MMTLIKLASYYRRVSSNVLFQTLVRRQSFSSASSLSARTYLQYEVKDDIAVITFDSPNKVNTLSRGVLQEFKDVLQEFKNDSTAKAAVLKSGKKDCFIAGADIGMLASCKTKDESLEVSETGQGIMNDIENCPKPIVSAIMGSCLGGGLEVALATHYRIAVKNKKTVLGVPEVMLGLLPGAGGTQRLTKLCSIPNAFDMMLTGKSLRADKAKKYGIVDDVVVSLGPGLTPAEERTHAYLEEIAIKSAKNMANGTLQRKPKKKGLQDKIMDKLLSYEFGQNFLIKQVKGKVMKQSRGLYPAPLTIIDIVKTTMAKGNEAGYQAEREGFATLATTPESKALIGLFHGQQYCKKNNYGKPEKKVQNISVLGAGLMGAGIAHVSIDKGYNVTLKDMASQGLYRGVQQIDKAMSTSVKRKKISQFDMDRIMAKLNPSLNYEGFNKQDIVIEAVFEDINIKHKVIKELEQHIPEHCIVASNTSALPIAKIAEFSKRPEKVIGMHYFSPVDKMQLVEIITTKQTSKDTIASAVDVSLKQGKTVIVVEDGPGFFTTRCLAPVLAEVLTLMREGVGFKQLDKVTKDMGFPVGTATLVDEVGIDVAAHISDYLGGVFGERFGDVSTLSTVMHELVNKKFLGRKSGKGLFVYSKDSKDRPENSEALEIFKKHHVEPRIPLTDEHISHRLLTRFVNEAVLCLQEDILHTPMEGDIGMVFGLGFPPCLGGPFRYLDVHGAAPAVKRMETFASQYGEAFNPCQLLIDHAKDSSKKFYKL